MMRESATWGARSPNRGKADNLGSYAKKVEMLFAHLKRILNLGRLRLREPNGARDEYLLAATAQNLRKLAKLTESESSLTPDQLCWSVAPSIQRQDSLRFAPGLFQQNLPIAVILEPI